MQMQMDEFINPIDIEALRQQVSTSEPFHNFCIDNFLKEDFAREVLNGFPSYSESLQMGRSFSAVNEKGKVQVTDSSKFPPGVAKLNEVLASPEFMKFMSYVMGIPNLVADPEMSGGGIHQTGPRGHLDVHVDFNYLESRHLHRRLNILVYLNDGWKKEWGGETELWDPEVKICKKSFLPIFNRCVVFETNEISFHGVTAVKCPPEMTRRSFAAYYYTVEAPDNWDGKKHSTIFKARPTEFVKGNVLMPAEKLKDWVGKQRDSLRDFVKGK